LNFLEQATTFPGVILPVFIVAVLVLAVVLRKYRPEKRWRYRDLVTAGCLIASAVFIVLAISAEAVRQPQAPAQAPPSIEVDMVVSDGNVVELWLNDWAHPSEKLTLVPHERHVYRFNNVPANISLVRLDPTEAERARIQIYSLTVKAGNRTVAQFMPAQLKDWTLHDTSAPKEEEGALVVTSTTTDPFVWTQLGQAVQLPKVKIPPPPSFARRHPGIIPGMLGLLPLVLLLCLLVADKRRVLAREMDREFFLKPWVVTAMALFAAVATYLALNQATDSSIVLEVDMWADRGQFMDVFVNDWQHEPVRVPVVEGQRRVYRITKLPGTISLLRLDPTDQPDARFVLYNVSIRNQTQVFLSFGPAELRNWARTNLNNPTEEGGGLAFSDLNNDPTLVANLRLHLPGGVWQSLSELIGTSDTLFLLPMVGLLLVLVARMHTHTGRMQALLVALVSCAVYPAVMLAIRLKLLGPPGVRAAIGFANYNGYPKGNEYLGAILGIVMSIALGLVFARFAGRGEEEPGKVDDARPSRLLWLLHVAVFVVPFVYFLPDLLAVFQSLGGATHPRKDWDAGNALSWAYLLETGKLPLRDFWYPYSGSFVQNLPFPTGPIFSAFHHAFILWLCYWGLFRVTGRRVTHTLAIFGLLLAPLLLDLSPAWNRYLLPVDIGLLYAATCGEKRLEWKTHGLFAAAIAYALFYEPTLVMYAGAGIAVHTVLSVIGAMWHRMPAAVRAAAAVAAVEAGAEGGGTPDTASWIGVVKQHLIRVGVPMGAGIVAGLAVYGALGMLPGLWDFERSLADQGVYAALPSDIERWAWPVLKPETIFLLMFLMVSCGVYRWVRMRGRGEDRLGAALIVIAFGSYLLMQKQILRPHMMEQVRIEPFAAVLIFALIVWRERVPRVRWIMAALAGCMLAVVVSRNLPGRVMREMEAGPRKVVDAVEVLARDANQFAAANRAMYSRPRFAAYEVENQVVDNLQQVCGLRAEDAVYVLGDYPIFYILLNKPLPYLTNLYNASPVYEQQKVVDWMRSRHPRYVIWGTDQLTFDSVPHTVRVPLIFEYVVEHYEYVRAIGPYRILMERPADHAPDLKYWRGVLSDGVDLGHIPELARGAEYEACVGDTAACDAVLTVRYARRVRRGKATAEVESADGPFRVQFDVKPQQREYVVNLSRLWFWRGVARGGVPKVRVDGAEGVVSYRRGRGVVLY
jgi:hypothetical protein